MSKGRQVALGHHARVIDALERVFGLDITGNYVRSVEIRAAVQEPVTAVVTRYVLMDEVVAEEVVERYRFVAVAEDEP